jgi:hypothetical protein
MDLVRKILQRAEEYDADKEPRHPFCETQTPEEVYQIALMKDAGLVDAETYSNLGKPSSATIFRLTWAGHDFLDASRDNTIWKKAVEHVIKPGTSWTFSLLTEWLKQEAKKRLGILPDA